MPSGSRYQLLQPVTQTVPFIAAFRDCWKAWAASRFGLSAFPSFRSSSWMQSRMYCVWVSETSMIEMFPIGLFGPTIMKKFGKPGIAMER